MIQQDSIEAMIKNCTVEIGALKTRQSVASSQAILYGAEASSSAYDTTVTLPAATVSASTYARIVYTLDHSPITAPVVSARSTWSSNHGFFVMNVTRTASGSPTSTSFLVVIENVYTASNLVISIKLATSSSAPGTLTYVVLP